MTIHLNLDMSLSREEFLRLLPAAVGLSPVEEVAGVFRGSDGSRGWTLRLMPLADRRVGSVVLPRHRVELRFDGYSEADVEAFMVRFHRGFQRGGG